jgi:hypothetical protein
MLAATSNPTRTSPVKRGKWVLEALLDQAPPPPPPSVPQLPEGATNTEHRSMRELMAMHRANPDCASCHVRMDAIGLAFERFDANGRTRTMVDGHAVEDTTELPGGVTITGVPGVATMVGTGTARWLGDATLTAPADAPPTQWPQFGLLTWNRAGFSLTLR